MKKVDLWGGYHIYIYYIYLVLVGDFSSNLFVSEFRLNISETTTPSGDAWTSGSTSADLPSRNAGLGVSFRRSSTDQFRRCSVNSSFHRRLRWWYKGRLFSSPGASGHQGSGQPGFSGFDPQPYLACILHPSTDPDLDSLSLQFFQSLKLTGPTACRRTGRRVRSSARPAFVEHSRHKLLLTNTSVYSALRIVPIHMCFFCYKPSLDTWRISKVKEDMTPPDELVLKGL